MQRATAAGLGEPDGHVPHTAHVAHVAHAAPSVSRAANGSAADGKPASPIARFFLQEDINFLLTNRLPRRQATLFMGWLSRVESPLFTRAAIAVWRLFADDLRLHEARTTEFKSLRECFIRELRPGARPVDPDPDVLVSPCDAVVGTLGRVDGTRLYQAKGFPYTLEDLLGDPAVVERHRDGLFVTLRLKANMYHRFHAPAAARVERIQVRSGDTWNVNPIALKRIENLFCKNERAIIELGLDRPEEALTLVAVASILVASIRIHAANEVFDLRYAGPPAVSPGDVPVAKGDELGFFQSGSTIIVFAKGPYGFPREVREGATIRVGQPLLRRQPC